MESPIVPDTLSEALQQINLGDLLVGTVKAVIQAQDQLDQHASDRVTLYAKTPQGTLAVPPLWQTIKNASIEISMSVAIHNSSLSCRLVNPHNVSLFGYEASAGTRVRLVVGPAGVIPISAPPAPATTTHNA